MSMQHTITEGHRNKRGQRKGRGESSGRGKTSGRGNKGSAARTGTYIRRGYEGGQTEIFRRFPKRGFSNNNFETKYYVVNLSDLGRFEAGSTIDAQALMDAGLIPDTKQGIKILGNGEFSTKLTFAVAKYSKSAHEKITAAGGTANDAKGNTFEFPKEKKKFVKRPKAKKEEAAKAE